MNKLGLKDPISYITCTYTLNVPLTAVHRNPMSGAVLYLYKEFCNFCITRLVQEANH